MQNAETRKMMFKKILLAAFIPLAFSGCQTMNDYVFLGSQQKLDKSSKYTLNKSADFNKDVEANTAALSVKKQIIGEYKVKQQWTTYLRWKIAKINIRLNDDNHLIADLYATENGKPFYGLQTSNCQSPTYTPQYFKDDTFRYEKKSKREKAIHDFHSLGPIAIKCGHIMAGHHVIEVLKVKKGYEQTVYETTKVSTALKVSKFIAPNDGYLIRLKDQYFSNPAIAEYVGIIAFTERLN